MSVVMDEMKREYPHMANLIEEAVDEWLPVEEGMADQLARGARKLGQQFPLRIF
jgi:hypothetical protein